MAYLVVRTSGLDPKVCTDGILYVLINENENVDGGCLQAKLDMPTLTNTVASLHKQASK